LWESVIILDFMRLGEDIEASALTIRTINAHTFIIRLNFTPDALPATTVHPGLGQASNMLDCIPGGLINNNNMKMYNVHIVKH